MVKDIKKEKPVPVSPNSSLKRKEEKKEKEKMIRVLVTEVKSKHIYSYLRAMTSLIYVYLTGWISFEDPLFPNIPVVRWLLSYHQIPHFNHVLPVYFLQK